MNLVEMAKEERTIATLLADAVESNGQAVLIEGPAGCGKTALLYRAADHAATARAVHLRACASTIERDLPCAVVHQLLRQAPGRAEVEQPQPLMGPDAAPWSLGKATAAAMQALSATVYSLAEQRPVLITVDDIHNGDAQSQLCLQQLIRMLPGRRIMVVVSEVSGLSSGDRSVRTEIMRHTHSTRIAVRRLSSAGVAEMVADLAGTEAAERWAQASFEATGGNPMLVRAMLEDTCQAASRSAGPETGREFRDALLTCLERSGPGVLEVGRGSAILAASDRLDPDAERLLPRLLQLSDTAVAERLEVLRQIGVLDRTRFRCAATKEALVDDPPPTQRVQLRLRAARLLQAHGAPAPRVASQLVAGGTAADAWASDILAHAAEVALGDDDTDFALRCLELAATSACEPQNVSLRTALARVEWRTNPATARRHFRELCDAHAGGHLSDSDTGLLLAYLLWHGCRHQASEVLERATSRVGRPAGRGLDVSSRLRLLASSHPYLRTSLPCDRDRRTEPLPWIDAAGFALHGVLSSGPREQYTRTAADLLRHARLADDTIEAIEGALLTFVFAERLGQAERWCNVVLSKAQRRAAPTWCAILLAVRAEIALRQGEFAAAHSDARAALAAIPRHGWGVAIGAPLSVLVLSATALQRFNDATEGLHLTVPEPMYDSRFGLQYLRARGHYALAVGNPHAALTDFRRCGALMEDWQLTAPGLVPWRIDAAQAHLRLHDRPEATRLIREQLALNGDHGDLTRGNALLLLAGTMEPAHRPSVLKEAADLLRTSGDRAGLANALLDLSHAYQLMGDAAQAGRLRRRGTLLARECRSDVARREADHDVSPRRPGPRDDGDSRDDAGAGKAQRVSRLSESEHRVAQLAALSYSNREISDRLFITVSTVEQHLTRVYRKLTITGRAELPDELQLSMEPCE